MNNVQHNRHRKSFDSTYAIVLYDQQVRECLDIKIARNPDKNVHWPEKRPVIGIIYE